jgi:hypothetical protein
MPYRYLRFKNCECVCDIDNITLKPAGAVLDLDFAAAIQYQVPDRSSNSLHGVVVGTPAFLNPPRYGQLRFRTNTNGNQQVLGQNCIPTNGRIFAFIINSDNSGTPVTSVNIGNASGGSQIAAAVAISAGRNEVGTFVSRYSGTGNIWINANGNSNLDITILFELVD